MSRNINSTKLTKNTILNKISQVNIFSVYLNIPINVIEHCIETGEFIVSPIRHDNNPTCGFKYDNKGRLKFKDFAGYFWGDCFDIAALILSMIKNKELNINKSENFIEVLQHIAITFKDIFYGLEKDPNLNSDMNNVLKKIKNKKHIIELVVRNWNEDDINYWKQFGIDIHTLNINFIYPVEQYYINRNINPEPKYYYNKKDPCYGYNLGVDRFNINSIKLYFPKRDKSVTKFISNCNHLEGIYNFNNNYDIIIITKSTKDRLALFCHINKMRKEYKDFNKYNIGFINIPHETYRLRDAELRFFKERLKDEGIILSLMDNDETGIKQANLLKEKYNIPYLLIPKRYKAKDFSDLILNTKFEEVSKLIIKTIKNIEYGKRNKFIQNKNSSGISPF